MTVLESATSELGRQARLLHELEPVVAQNLERHLARTKDWHPHDYVPWSRGRDFAFLGGEDWQPEDSALDPVAKTAMVVTTDCGDANDIHPPRKQPVGARLALAARALAYGERLEYSGPVFDALKVKGGNATLTFTHLGGGLVARGGPGRGLLRGFTMAGADGTFHPARAEIHGKTVIVTSETVPRPVAVRYGWANVPDGNLFNRAGLPASPFRTDAN